MLQRSFYPRFGRLICLLCLMVFPGLVFLSYRVMQNSNNNVVDWLPSGFQQTADLYWFNERFGIDAILVLSWTDCHLDDPRLDLLQQSMLDLRCPGLDGQPQPLFHRVFTGRSTLAQLTTPPLEVSHDRALERMQGWLVGADGRTTCVVGFLTHEGWWDRHATIDVVVDAAKDAGIDPQTLRLGGPAVDSVAIDRVSQRWLVPLALASTMIGVLMTWICLREFRLVAAVFLYAGFAWFASLAAVELFGAQLDAVLTVMPALVYVLAVSAAIHMTGYYRRALRQGSDQCPLTAAVSMGWAPCTVAAATTALGLGSLMISQLIPIRKFGFFAAWGTLLALGLLLLLWPALLSRLFRPRRPGESDPYPAAASAKSRSWWQPLMNVAVSGWPVILLLLGVSLVALTLGVTRLRASVGLRDLFSPNSQVIRDYAWLEANIGPLIPIEVVLRVPEPDVQDPREMLERLLMVERIRRQIQEMPVVGGTIAASRFVPDIPSGRAVRSVSRRAVIARHLLDSRQQLKELGMLHDEWGGAEGQELLEEQWRISARIEAISDLEYGSVLKEFTAQVRQMLAQDETARRLRVTENISGGVFLVAMAQQRLLVDLAESFGLAFVLISIAMTVLTRSLAIGAMAMITNLFPVVLIFGLMGWGGMPVDVGTMMTACVALGIAVDDASHFLTWYRRAFAEGHRSLAALRMAYQHCATPMLQTSMICGLGMLVFVVNPFMPAARFGWLMFTLLFAALTANLLILPALLASAPGRWLVAARLERQHRDPGLSTPTLHQE